MKKLILINSVLCWTFLFTTILSGKVFADCSCKPDNIYLNTIGYEFKATSCPTPDASYLDTNVTYRYVLDFITCQSEKIYRYAPYGDTVSSPKNLMDYYIGQGAKVLTNPTGTHIIVVVKTSYPYQGLISGVNVSTIGTSPYVSDALNQYCNSSVGLADTDGDGYPDCIDCASADPLLAIDCPAACSEPGQMTEEQVTALCLPGERPIFDPDQCQGYCLGLTQGCPTCP